MDQIRLGLRPQGQDDRWFAFCENDTIFFHRSESGHGIFEASMRQVDGGGFVVSNAAVTGDLTRYKRSTDEIESTKLGGMISVLLAGRAVTPHARQAVASGKKDKICRVLHLRGREGSAVQVDGPVLRVFNSNQMVIDEIDMAELGELQFSRVHMLTNQNCNYFAGRAGRSSPLAFSVIRYGQFGESLIANNWYRTGGGPEFRATYEFIGH